LLGTVEEAEETIEKKKQKKKSLFLKKGAMMSDFETAT
jgi:hypothetical protein